MVSEGARPWGRGRSGDSDKPISGFSRKSTFQKHPDVHKIVLSIKSRSPPPPGRKKCRFWGFFTDLYSFSSFWALFGGGGGVNQILRRRILWTPRLFRKMPVPIPFFRNLVVRIARPTSLAIWHRGRSHRREAFVPKRMAETMSLVWCRGVFFWFKNPGNHANLKIKNALGVKRPFSEQLLKFRRFTIRGRGNLPLRGLCGGLSRGLCGLSAGSLRGFCGGPRDFPRFFGGSDPMLVTLQNCWKYLLSGPLRLRVQSRSRTRLRIAASIAFLFRACFKRVLDTIGPLSRG